MPRHADAAGDWHARSLTRVGSATPATGASSAARCAAPHPPTAALARASPACASCGGIMARSAARRCRSRRARTTYFCACVRGKGAEFHRLGRQRVGWATELRVQQRVHSRSHDANRQVGEDVKRRVGLMVNGAVTRTGSCTGSGVTPSCALRRRTAGQHKAYAEMYLAAARALHSSSFTLAQVLLQLKLPRLRWAPLDKLVVLWTLCALTTLLCGVFLGVLYHTLGQQLFLRLRSTPGHLPRRAEPGAQVDAG